MTMLSAPGRTRIGGESSFASAAVTLLPVKCQLDTSGLSAEVLRDEHTRQGDYETAKIVGGYTGTVEVKLQLHGFASSNPSAAPSVTGPTGMGATGFDIIASLVGTAFGGLYAGGYGTSLTLSDPGSAQLGASSLSSFTPGMPVGYLSGDTRHPYEVNWITDVTEGTPDVADLLVNRNFSPTGTKLWGGITAFVRDLDPNLEAQSIASYTIEHQYHGSDDLLLCYGCQPIGLKIEAEAGKVPMLTITMGVGHWEITQDGSWPVSPISWSYPQPTIAANWRCIGPGGGILAVKGFTFDLGLTRTAIPDGQYPSGIGGWYAAQRRPTVAVQVFRNAAGEQSLFSAQNGYPLVWQWGVGPGRGFSLCLPNARVVELPKATDRDGALISDLKFEGHYYDGDNDTDATKPGNSPARFCWI